MREKNTHLYFDSEERKLLLHIFNPGFIKKPGCIFI